MSVQKKIRVKPVYMLRIKSFYYCLGFQLRRVINRYDRKRGTILLVNSRALIHWDPKVALLRYPGPRAPTFPIKI